MSVLSGQRIRQRLAFEDEGVARRELLCRGCGYGIVVANEPPQCPMCRGKDWRSRRSPFALRRHALDLVAA